MSAPTTESLDIAALREVLERDPGSPLFHDLAQACSEAGQWDEAVRVLRSGLRFHPEHLEARLLLGSALARLGEPEGARAELEAAAEHLGRISAGLYPRLAAIYEEADQPEGALRYLRLAAAYGAAVDGERLERLQERLRREHGRGAAEQASALMGEGRAEEAAGLLREALEEAPESAELQGRLEAAEAEAAQGREAGQVISVLQRWLQNIKDEANNG